MSYNLIWVGRKQGFLIYNWTYAAKMMSERIYNLLLKTRLPLYTKVVIDIYVNNDKYSLYVGFWMCKQGFLIYKNVYGMNEWWVIDSFWIFQFIYCAAKYKQWTGSENVRVEKSVSWSSKIVIKFPVRFRMVYMECVCNGSHGFWFE